MEPNLSTKEIVAGNVRAEMARNQLNIKEMADALGISTPSARRRFVGKIDFTIPEIEKISIWLDVPLSRLMSPLGPSRSYSERQTLGKSAA